MQNSVCLIREGMFIRMSMVAAENHVTVTEVRRRGGKSQDILKHEQ